MNLVCLDLEGVLVPEIWISVAEKTGIEELQATTRDIPDYDQLMRRRLGILDQNGLTLRDIQEVIRGMEPLPGAYDFQKGLRRDFQLIILSDTFTEFASPLMEKLDQPTLFCNTLKTDPSGRIRDYTLRQPDGKTKAVRALQDIGMRVFAAGDSYNDTGMLLQADHAAFFRAPDSISREFPSLDNLRDYKELLLAIRTYFKD